MFENMFLLNCWHYLSISISIEFFTILLEESNETIHCDRSSSFSIIQKCQKMIMISIFLSIPIIVSSFLQAWFLPRVSQTEIYNCWRKFIADILDSLIVPKSEKHFDLPRASNSWFLKTAILISSIKLSIGNFALVKQQIEWTAINSHLATESWEPKCSNNQFWYFFELIFKLKILSFHRSIKKSYGKKNRYVHQDAFEKRLTVIHSIRSWLSELSQKSHWKYFISILEHIVFRNCRLSFFSSKSQ